MSNRQVGNLPLALPLERDRLCQLAFCQLAFSEEFPDNSRKISEKMLSCFISNKFFNPLIV